MDKGHHGQAELVGIRRQAGHLAPGLKVHDEGKVDDLQGTEAEADLSAKTFEGERQ